MNKLRLLVTKKISPSLALRAGLKGIDVLEKEFIVIEPVAQDKLNEALEKIISEEHTVAFTSKNAVAAVAYGRHVKDSPWKIYCTEGATQDQVKKYFREEQIVASAKNAKELADKIAGNANGEKNIIFFCGNQRRDELPELLTAAGFTVKEIIVYETKLSPQAIIDDYDAVAFFSPSAVKSFFSANKLNEKAVCLSVGKTTTDAIGSFTKNKIITAPSPSEASVLGLADEIKNNR